MFSDSPQPQRSRSPGRFSRWVPDALQPSFLSRPPAPPPTDTTTGGANYKAGLVSASHTTQLRRSTAVSETGDSSGSNMALHVSDGAERRAHTGTRTPPTAAKAAARHNSNLFSRFARRRPSRLLQLLMLALALTVFAVMYGVHFGAITLMDAAGDEATPAQAQLILRMLKDAPWSVLVRHGDAATRHGPPPPRTCKLYRWHCKRERGVPLLLPAWTLRVVDPNCTFCTDRRTYATAMAQTNVSIDKESSGDAAVFASAAAPLGRIGSMLLAMLSVTNGVHAEEELPKWSWMLFTSHGSPPAHASTLQPPYLAVMGVPSTDQLGRASLRDAQRETWMSFREVARAENNFDGALLPLYIFAAVEPANNSDRPVASASTAPFRHFNASHLLPTREEFHLMTSARLNVAAAAAATADEEDADAETAGAVAGRAISYTLPRVALRGDWRTASRDDSPCASVYRVTMDGSNFANDPVVHLAAELGLPITPAAVSPAEYICHASAGLWQEALEHRNMVWIDMMTDRRPTTKKKLGEDGKWGLAVEVGMSQKLILWLEYAYHAFPGVPYIMKGDDDAYLKVPQFLSDVRFVLSKNGSNAMQRTPPAILPAAPRPEPHTALCTYWGSTRSVAGTRFNAGMGFMLHRFVAQAVLEPRNIDAIVKEEKKAGVMRVRTVEEGMEHIYLAVRDFNLNLSAVYTYVQYNWEDVMLGCLIRNRLPRIKALCPLNKVFYVRETFTRFHDLRVGRARRVTWASVVVHRCRVTDFRFVHYYFQHEHRMPVWANSTMEEEEAAARVTAAEWVATQKNTAPQYDTWDDLPAVQWVSRGNGPVAVPREVDPVDGVAVYMHRYKDLYQPQFQVDDGYASDP